MSHNRLSAAAAALGLALLVRTADAAEIIHVVAPGETLGAVATAYYGSSWKSVYIAARNGVSNEREVAVGTRLVIPAGFTYRVRRGDSFADIARRYLGDRERYRVLMQENGVKDAADLEVGAELLMPFHLRHAVEPGESWSRIAQRYYRTTRRAGLVKDYNLGTEALSPGDRVTVPIFDRATLDAAGRRPSVRPAPAGAAIATATATAANRAHEPASDVAPGRTTSPAVRTAIQKAVDDFRRGEYEAACPKKLEALLADSALALNERALLVLHLGFCAVAGGERAAAMEYFRKWREIDPRAQLDPITTSPKILAVFQEVLEAEQEAGDGGG